MSDKPRILVVDDEPQITRVLRTSLSTYGYDVRIANDGEAGLAAFQEWEPDLVITDLSMPKMTGIELCESIRDHSQVPIIVLSVKGEDKIKVDALDKGADDYVTKPFSINELLARIPEKSSPIARCSMLFGAGKACSNQNICVSSSTSSARK